MNNYNKLEKLKEELHKYILELYKYNKQIDSRKVTAKLTKILNMVE